jgi:transcriptional regulator with XRE-family HTH domain
VSLARLRKSKGYSQRSLAKKAGTSSSTIYEIEVGRHSPNPTTLIKLANALGVSTEEVMEALEEEDRRAYGELEELVQETMMAAYLEANSRVMEKLRERDPGLADEIAQEILRETGKGMTLQERTKAE